MAKVTLVRIDYRLVHGQVAVKWSKAADATKIIVVDDKVAKDDMMKNIFKMAAPPGVKVLCYSVEKCISKWNEKQFGDGRVMMMFKDVDTCYRTFKAGYPLEKLQLGNIPKKTGRNQLDNEVFASPEEIAQLKEMAAAGVDIIIHTIPEKSAVSFEKATKNL